MPQLSRKTNTCTIREVIKALLANLQVPQMATEPREPFFPHRSRRADTLVHSNTLLDITCKLVDSDDVRLGASTTKRHAAKVASRAKHQQCEATGATFLPLLIQSEGAFGPKLDQFKTHLSNVALDRGSDVEAPYPYNWTANKFYGCARQLISKPC